MSFQAVGPEDSKEHGPKLVMQDRRTSSLLAPAERSRERPGMEVSNVLLLLPALAETVTVSFICECPN